MYSLCRLLICLLLPMLAAPALAEDIPAFIHERVPHAQVAGQGTMTYMLWDVYDAQLIAPDGIYSPRKPFALRLAYLRHVDGGLIADSSTSEIARQGFTDEARLDAWHKQMSAMFADVDPQTTLSGVYVPGKPTCFFRNDKTIGCVDDPDFGPYFFNIWLGPNTRDPDLRKALLGKS